MKMNFIKIGLVASLVTLVYLGVYAQNTFPLVGNTGVNTTSPLTNFHIQTLGVTGLNGRRILLGTVPTSEEKLNYLYGYLGFNGYRDNSTGSWKFDSDGWNNGGSIITSTTFGEMRFLTLGTHGVVNSNGSVSNPQTPISDMDFLKLTRMQINATGQVQICDDNGVANYINPISQADVRLTVNGKIYATGVKVLLPTNGYWPDYVFKKGYKLAPLSEVETFIAANCHLPNVPSEAEVKGNGIDMAEMDAVLLRKIEELTLYLIQLKKENEELSKKVEALGNQ